MRSGNVQSWNILPYEATWHEMRLLMHGDAAWLSRFRLTPLHVSSRGLVVRALSCKERLVMIFLRAMGKIAIVPGLMYELMYEYFSTASPRRPARSRHKVGSPCFRAHLGPRYHRKARHLGQECRAKVGGHDTHEPICT